MAPAAPLQASPSAASQAGVGAFGANPASRPVRTPSRIRPFLAAVILAILAAVPASKAQSSTEPVPDFLLRDVNPNSPRNTKIVSPRDYRLQISAYYFGAAG